MYSSAMARLANSAAPIKPNLLYPDIRGEKAELFESELTAKIIDQTDVIAALVHVYQMFLSGMSPVNRPVANLLFAGPTGSGKTHAVETAAQILLGSKTAVTKIDCAEFQQAHETAKLTGPPPGYTGYNDVAGMLSQENIDRGQTHDMQLNFVLFDEIEKANQTLWELLLGIMDKGVLTLGNTKQTDFRRTIIIMTSNLGAWEIQRMVTGSMGFVKHQSTDTQVLHKVVMNAVRRKFSPEFMNRIDRTVVFNSLTHPGLCSIVALEMQNVQMRIITSNSPVFILCYTQSVVDFLIKYGTDARYGARELKRTIETHIVAPLSNLMATGQVDTGETVTVDILNDAPVFSSMPPQQMPPIIN